MPARNIYHDRVRQALIKDGWTITHDPLRLKWGGKDLYVDLGAEQVLGAEKGERRIAVEVQSFLGPSEVKNLENALGQFVLYETVMRQTEPDRTLYLAVHEEIWREVFEEPLGQLLLRNQPLRMIVFDEEKEVILRWIP